MKRSALIAGMLLCATPLAIPASLHAAPKAAVKAAYKAPRTSAGQPDLGGYWTNATITSEARPATVGGRAVYTPQEVAELEGGVQREVQVGNRSVDPNAPPPSKGGDPIAEGIRPQLYISGGGATGGYDRGWLDPGASVMRVGGEPRTSFLTTPDGRVPARKGAQPVAARGGGAGAGGGAGRGGAAAVNGGRGGPGAFPSGGPAENPEQRSLGDRCILSFGRNGGPPMLANGFYNNNYHLVQGKDSVAIETEMVHDTRVVHLNAKHRTDGVRPYFGDSIGHYEGDTLVVETTNIPQSQAYNGSWEHLTVTEKFRRVSPTRLFYQYTIHDPTLWDADWGGEYEFAALQPGQHVEEYACHEGNYALWDILAGARAEEAAARAAAR